MALPMFPLSTVLFPTMLLPLHVFEPRYRVLIESVVEGDGEFGVVLIARGHEVGGGEQRHDVGTVARLLEVGEIEGGRYVALTLGTRRVHVTRWLADDPHPWAEVVERADIAVHASLTSQRDELERRLRRVLGLQAELGESVPPATLSLDSDAVAATWQAASLAPLNPFDAQELLEEDDPATRLARLLDLLADIHELLDLQLHA